MVVNNGLDLCHVRCAAKLQITSILSLARMGRSMGQRIEVNPLSEHALFLRLFITNGGGM